MITPVVIKNTVNEEKYITDLSNQYVGPLATMILSDFYTFIEIANSQTLKDYVNDGTFIINDGSSDLPTQDAINHVSEITNFESKKTLLSLNDIPVPPGTFPLEHLIHNGSEFTWGESRNLDGVNGGISFTMSDHAANDFVGNGVSAAWVSIRSFIFDGTDFWTPKNFSVIGSLSKPGATGYARLYDYTNNQIISTLEWSDHQKLFHNTTTINNLASGQSILELQTKTSKSGTDVRTHFVAVY